MARRLHKVLGYGLRPFAPDKRFYEACKSNPPLWVWANTFVEEVLQAGADAISLSALLHSHPGWVPHDSLVYDDENICDLLVIVPPEEVDRWTRYDDTIDYLEVAHGTLPDRREPRAVDLSSDSMPLRGLYPAGDPPVSVRLLLAYIGLGHRVVELRETLYTYWS